MKKIAVVPTLLTLGNGVCGFVAITWASKIVTPGDSAFNIITPGDSVLVLVGEDRQLDEVPNATCGTRWSYQVSGVAPAGFEPPYDRFPQFVVEVFGAGESVTFSVYSDIELWSGSCGAAAASSAP